MLKIFKDIYFNFAFKLFIFFVISFIILFVLLLPYHLETFLWCQLLLLWVFVYSIVIFMLNTLHKKLDEDIASIAYYLKKIDAKEYDAELKIENYLEFLEIALLLKNLIKRLYNRDKKKR